MNDLTELATSAAYSHVGASVAIKTITAALEQDPDRETLQAGRLLFDSLATKLFDDIGSGNSGKPRELLAALRVGLTDANRDHFGEAQDGREPLPDLSPRDRLRVRLAVLEEIAETYLRSNNLLRLCLSLLDGGKREALRKARDHGRPLTGDDLLGAKPTSVLSDLVRDRLLERREDGPELLYAVTWTGIDALKAWSNLGLEPEAQ